MTGFARRFIYFPDQRATPPLPPGDQGEGVALLTGDGLALGAWFFPAPNPAATVLVANGNAGNRADRLPLALGLQRRGLATLLFDYRGYGGNPGEPSEKGLISDAEAARQALETRPDVDPDRIAYFGESLGAAVLVALAGRRPPAALVLRSPFTSLLEVARAHLPFVPASLLDDRWESIERIRSLDVPLLVLAGTRDSVVPYAQSVRLLEMAPGPKRLVGFEGADHNDAVLTFGDALLDETARFLRESLGPRPDPGPG